MRENLNTIGDYISFEYRGPLHNTDDYRGFGAYRGIDPNLEKPRWHASIDAGGSDDLGMNVYPVIPGVVTKEGWEDSLGNYIVVKHETEYGTAYSVYGHLGTKGGNGYLVEEGDVVDKDTPIGTLGNTTSGSYEEECKEGCMTAHLHFEIRYETNVNTSEGIMGMHWWAFDSNWVYDFFDLGQIYGYFDNAAQGNPPLP